MRDQGRVPADSSIVGTFLNHRVDTEIIRGIGETIAEQPFPCAPEMNFTAQANGIPRAMDTAWQMRLPLNCARKLVVEHCSSDGRALLFRKHVILSLVGTASFPGAVVAD